MVLKGKQFYIQEELCDLLSINKVFLPDTVYYGEDIENAIVEYCDIHQLWHEKEYLSIHMNNELMTLCDTQRHIMFLDDLYHIVRPFLVFAT